MKTIAFLLCLGILSSGCGPSPEASTAAAIVSDKPLNTAGKKKLPNFDLANVQGGTLKTADLKGKVAIIDFWATWCENCIPEIPEYNELREKYSDKGFEVVGITMDSGSAKDIKPKAEAFKMKYPVVVGDDSVLEGFGGIIGYPTTFLISRDGTVVKKILGSPPGKKDQLQKDIDSLLTDTQ
jgi:thiol-disulfide isomerase/thioredoxin